MYVATLLSKISTREDQRRVDIDPELEREPKLLPGADRLARVDRLRVPPDITQPFEDEGTVAQHHDAEGIVRLHLLPVERRRREARNEGVDPHVDLLVNHDAVLR